MLALHRAHQMIHTQAMGFVKSYQYGGLTSLTINSFTGSRWDFGKSPKIFVKKKSGNKKLLPLLVIPDCSCLVLTGNVFLDIGVATPQLCQGLVF
jgi:hypothetical protein